MTTARTSRPSWVALIVSALPLAGNADPISELDDAAARIQYASYTADTRGIEDAVALVQRLELPASRKAMKEYYTAYGQWKLAEAYADEATAGRRAARASSTKAAKACEEAAAAALDIDPRLAEVHAMQAVCSTLASGVFDVLSLGGCVRHKGLRTARELEPTNVRVRLIEAQCLLEGEKNPEPLLKQIQTLVNDFDAAPPVSPGRPDWGHAEALVLLGRLQLGAGNAVAARDALERALVIAPDYREAQKLLQQSAGSR